MDELRRLIPEEARARGYIQIYRDTPPEVEAAVKAYNLTMAEWKKMYKRAKSRKTAIILITPFVWAILLWIGITGKSFMGDLLWDYLSFGTRFWNLPICITVMAIYAPIYVYWGFLKENVFVVSLLSFILIAVKPYAVLLFAADMMMYFLYRRNDDPIRRELEYPWFNKIDIKYLRMNTPGFDRKYT